MTVKIDDVTVFNDIRERLLRITPEQVAATERRLADTDSMHLSDLEDIGVITSYTTRALYTLGNALSAEEALELAKAKNSTSEIDEKDHMAQAAILDMLSDAVRQVFWAQAKLDLGFHECASVGMRSNWRLVKMKDASESGFALAKLLNLGR
jgi:hypothetical protein